MLGAYGYKTKKELKENIGKPLRYVETSMFGSEYPKSGNGTCLMVGPNAYNNRKWYAKITLVDGIITKVE